MSIFKKVADAHEKKVEEARLSAEAKRRQESSEQSSFKQAFIQAAIVEVEPYFKKLQRDILESDRSCHVESQHDEAGNFYVELRFNPKKGVVPDDRDYCKFIISVDRAKRSISWTMLAGRDSNAKVTDDIELKRLNEAGLEKLVETFFARSFDLAGNA
nr:hypothetical protein [uncultured Duganella sp.]